MIAEKQNIKNELLFQVEECKDGETIFQTGAVWCEDCQDWIDNVELNKEKNYLCCSHCDNGVVKLT